MGNFVVAILSGLTVLSCCQRSMPKIFFVLLEVLGFIVSCNLTYVRLTDFTTAVVLKPIVNT